MKLLILSAVLALAFATPDVYGAIDEDEAIKEDGKLEFLCMHV